MIEKEIEIINKIILEAVVYGSDGGGIWILNEDALTSAITSWLKFKGIDSEYEIKKIKEAIQTEYQGRWSNILQIVKRC